MNGRTDGLTAADSTFPKVSYTRAGKKSVQNLPSGAVSCQDSVRRKRAKTDHLAAYDASNRTAAALILAAAERHGGPEGLAVRWARLVVERGGLSVELQQMPEQAELFAEACNADPR